MEKFDDTKLVTLAKSLYYNRGKEPDSVVMKTFTKETLGTPLTNLERNALLDFIQANALSGNPMSMTNMKKQILLMIGYELPSNTGYSYGANNVNRKELQAIYEWFVKKGFRDGTKSNS